MATKNILKAFLLIAFATETLCATVLLLEPDLAKFNTILYFISGISIAFIILFLPQAKKITFDFNRNAETYLRVSLITITTIALCYFSISIMHDNPVDYHNADMLPVIKTMDKRFLEGNWRHVYDRIPEIWTGSDPIYLPAMWLPFTPAVLFHIDLRWISVLCLAFVFAYSIALLSFKKITSYIILALAAILLAWILSEDDTHGLISFSEEPVVIVYYFLLVLAIVSENIFFIGIMACLCMLSRYVLVGWIPAFFILLLLEKKKKQAFTFFAFGILFFLFGFLLPFGTDAFVRLLHLPGNYIEFSKRVWQDSPEAFTDYLGFAKFFVPGKIYLLHNILITLSFSLPLLFMIACHFLKERIKLSNIPLACLKTTIVVFYNFMDVPYLYLLFTSTFVSLLIVIHFTREIKQPELVNAH
jgi:hypothetical protein